MKRAAFLLVLVLCSCGATLRTSATAPSFDNEGTCGAPILKSVSSTNPVWVHFQWTGPSNGEDSILTVSGVRVTLTKSLPSGTYAVRCWASDSGGVGCDTTASFTIKGPPSKPRIGLIELLDKITVMTCYVLPRLP